MSICWYCHWGWPKEVADIYQRALDELGYESPLDYGPGHLVWADENWDCVDWCLEHFDEYTDMYTPEEMVIARRALEELRDIPLERRDVCPEDYDDANPQNYPPPAGVVMVDKPGEY